VLRSLQCPDLGEQLADRFGLREPGDIELLGAFLGADKDCVIIFRFALGKCSVLEGNAELRTAELRPNVEKALAAISVSASDNRIAILLRWRLSANCALANHVV
jgi:hypothetical protein